MIRSAPLLCLVMLPLVLAAQERCGTVQYTEKLRSEKRIPANDLLFEKWLKNKLGQRQSGRSRRRQATYQIPVVVHVIHNGENIGTGTNLSDAQILSQLSVLNKDFKRLNDDAINTPSVFAAVAGAMDIEFVLARQSPEGLETNGIVRVRGSKSSWTVDDNYELKSLSYWPSDDYMNIWVCNLTDLLGYAQLPEYSLPGLENASTNALTDGVVITHRAFGSDDDGNFNLIADYNKGRTATHEVGHFFGLRHIWGDDGGSCSGTDYVPDTPNQAGNTVGCPTHPRTDNCDTPRMFQNFLDYTDDECMNLFTQGQIDRMMVVLENSPRRASLLNSPGLHDPVPTPNDLGIKAIISPDATSCGTSVVPMIKVRNYGSNVITSARIRVTRNGVTQETRLVPLNLGVLDSATVSFNPVPLSPGNTTISFAIIETNGTTDSKAQNNTLSTSVFVPEAIGVPFSENFNVMPAGWVIQNPDQQITWTLTTAPAQSPSNKALVLNFYNYNDAFGELDVLMSPVFDLASAQAASLSFDVAYARFESSTDRLRVVVLTNCEDILDGTVVYDKEGDALATTCATPQPFTPGSKNDWRTERISLTDFAGEPFVQIAFVGINAWGNNLYLDNISLTADEAFDLALVDLLSPAVVSCDGQVALPSVRIRNAGNTVITDFTIDYAINGGPTLQFPVAGVSIPSLSEHDVILPPLNLAEGENILHVTVRLPDGLTDVAPADNEKTFARIVDRTADRIPLRQTFDQSGTQPWIMVSPTGGTNWAATSTNDGTSAYFSAFNNTAVGDKAWLVSPVLDFSAAAIASIVFDVSHGAASCKRENLSLMVSEDCGRTYGEIPIAFESRQGSGAWEPESDDDWHRNIEIDLSHLAGKSEVRVAFVAENQNGNNLFLDNIEFFTTERPFGFELTELYSIYGYNLSEPLASELKISFNLPERAPIRFAITDVMGRMFADRFVPDVLNQTFPLPLHDSVAPGVYFVRISIGNRVYTEKVLVAR